MPKDDIQSESEFVLSQLKFIIMLPITIVMILFRKKELSELTKPFSELISFTLQPKATIILIAINIIVFTGEIFFISGEVFSSLVFRPENLYALEPLPIIASMFLHASIAHLLGNMLFLFIFGRIIENHFGSMKMLLIYFGSGIIADIISGLVGQGGIGASGAIAGLIGTAILVKPFYLTYLIIGIPLPIIIVGWIAILTDISGILYPNPNENIGHFAHLGGYIAISLIVFFLSKEDKNKIKLGLMLNFLFVIIYLLIRGYIF